MSSGGSLRSSLRRLFSLTSSETTLVKSETPPAPNNRVLIVGLGNYPAPRSRHSVGMFQLGQLIHQQTPESCVLNYLNPDNPNSVYRVLRLEMSYSRD